MWKFLRWSLLWQKTIVPGKRYWIFEGQVTNVVCNISTMIYVIFTRNCNSHTHNQRWNCYGWLTYYYCCCILKKGNIFLGHKSNFCPLLQKCLIKPIKGRQTRAIQSNCNPRFWCTLCRKVVILDCLGFPLFLKMFHQRYSWLTNKRENMQKCRNIRGLFALESSLPEWDFEEWFFRGDIVFWCETITGYHLNCCIMSARLSQCWKWS